MKSKFLLVVAITTLVFTTVCAGQAPEVTYSKSQVVEKSQTNDLDDEIEIFTLKDELGMDYNKLTKVEIEKLSTIYDEIATFEFTDDNEELYNELWYDFNFELISIGIDVPFVAYYELAEEYSELLSDIDYDRIITIDEKIELTGDEAISDEEYEKLNQELIDIFDKYKLPGREVKNQVDMGNIQLALFDVKDGKIILSEDTIKENVSNDDIALYEKFWKHINVIIPSSYIEMLTKFEINTDGMGNVMAHVIEEKDDLSIWRLAVDLRDSVDSKAEFTSEFNNTIIHEFAHVMTLNKNQMQIGDIIDETTFEVQEGILKKDSYINKFYDKFWKDIYIENQEALDDDFEEGVIDGGDALVAFYEKYKDRFVTEYAATNPCEDIAESYRVFVVEDKPVGDSIKDKKVLFFYEMDEFVKIREEIRKNLGL